MGKMFMKVPRTAPLRIRESRQRPAQLTFADLGRWVQNTWECGVNYISADRTLYGSDEKSREACVNYLRERYEVREIPIPEEEEEEDAVKSKSNSKPTTSSDIAGGAKKKQLSEDEIQVVPEDAATLKKASKFGNLKGEKKASPKNWKKPDEKKKKSGVKTFFLNAFRRFKKS